MCQISSLMPAAEGPVAEFSTFANFEERKRKSNLLISFLKIVHQKGSFGQIRKNLSFRFCRPILEIFGFMLLSSLAVNPSGRGLYDASRLLRMDFTSEADTATLESL